MRAIAYDLLADSPLGPVLVVASRTHVTAVDFGPKTESGLLAKARTALPGQEFVRDAGPPGAAIAALAAYFDGRQTAFDLPLDLSVGTAFQQQVWRATLRVPYGQPSTYGQIAAAIGNPRASRAVGTALGHNPIAIFVPCHRILGANGRIGGYTGGLRYKRALLALEGFR